MRVAILEDDPYHRELLLKSIQNHALFQEPSIDIVACTGNPNEVIQLMNDLRIDCYFLDIELHGLVDGMQLAQMIRDKDPLAHLIFVTTHADRLPLTFTYKLAALDFIVKQSPGQITSMVVEALKAASAKYRQLGKVDTSKWFQIKVGEKVKNIPLQDIYCFETSIQPHKLELYEKNGRYIFYGALKELTMLGDDYFRCHKSCYINLRHVVELNSKERSVVMTNGHRCPVSFRLMKELHKKLKGLI